MTEPRDAAIFDVDGTLCNVSSIRHHVNPKDPRFSGRKRFDLFHEESVDCPPNREALHLHARCRNEGLAVIIVTARKFQWRYHTITWLMEWGVDYDALFMRPDNDNRKDFLVKEDILTAIKAKGYQPVLAVDDNPSVLEVWKRHGIETITIPGWEE